MPGPSSSTQISTRPLAISRAPSSTRTARLGVLDGVAEQVAKGLRETVAIGVENPGEIDLCAQPAIRRRFGARDQIVQKRRELDRLAPDETGLVGAGRAAAGRPSVASCGPPPPGRAPARAVSPPRRDAPGAPGSRAARGSPSVAFAARARRRRRTPVGGRTPPRGDPACDRRTPPGPASRRAVRGSSSAATDPQRPRAPRRAPSASAAERSSPPAGIPTSSAAASVSVPPTANARVIPDSA